MTSILTTRSKNDQRHTARDVVEAGQRARVTRDVVIAALRDRLFLPVTPIACALNITVEQVRAANKVGADTVAAFWETVTWNDEEVVVPEQEPGWETAAACVGKDPSMWFCDDDDCETELEAVAVCVGCPVIGNCAIAGLFEQDGVWAGLTPRGRRDLRKYIRLEVVPPTPVGVTPLAAAMAAAALRTKTAKQPAVKYAPDGRLFDLPPVGSTLCRVGTKRNARPVVTVPLFA